MTYPPSDPNQCPQYNQGPQPGSPPLVKRTSRGGLFAGIAIGAVAAVLALMAFGYFMANETADQIRSGGDGPLGSPTEWQSSQDVGSEDAANRLVSKQAMLAIYDFDLKRDDVLAEILKRFRDDNFSQDNYHVYEGRSIEQGLPNMSPTALLDRNSAKNAYLMLFLDRSQALSQIDIAARPGTTAYQNFEDRINSYHAGTAKPSADEDILIQSKYFDNGQFVDDAGNVIVEAVNTPTQVISAMSQRLRTNTVYTFQWDTTSSGPEGDWRLITAATKPGHDGYLDPLKVSDLQIR